MIVAPEFTRLIRPLDKYADHRLQPDAIDAAYRAYRVGGVEHAQKLVKLLCERFEDVRHDSYLTPEVFA